MAALKLFDRDVGNVLTFIVNGIANLTGASVSFVCSNGKSFACAVTDATNRVAQYTVQSTDFDAGSYQGQIRVTVSGNEYNSELFDVEIGQAL